MRAGGAHRVLLCVAPAIPCALHRRFNQVEPLLLISVVGRRRQGEQLPSPVIANQRHYRLAAGPADVAIRSRIVGVGGHQSLLDGENEVVCGVQRGRRQRRIVTPKSKLEGANRLAQWLRRLGVVVEAKRLNVIK